MRDQVRHELSLVGLQRSGSNYIGQVLRASLQGVQVNYAGWKHGFRDEADLSQIRADLVIVARHPVLWLQSCLLNSSKDLQRSRESFFADGVDPVIAFANIYSMFYGGWLEYKRSVGAYLLRYEDVLERGPALLKDIFPAGYEISDAPHEILVVPQSVQLGPEELKAVVSRECTLPRDTAEKFWARIDPAVSSGLGYTLKEINFTGSVSEEQRLRTAAYKLTEKPNTLSDEEFDLLLRRGKERFKSDGAVLGKIGAKLMNAGDIEGALDWLMQAVHIIRQNDDPNFRRELDPSLALYLELLTRGCKVIRQRTLERIKQRHVMARPRGGHGLAGKEWNLSLYWSKLGRTEEAIDHAERAIEIAETVPTRRGEIGQWTQNLGGLLSKVGRHLEAVEKFRQAAAREPSDFRHHYALAREFYRSGDAEHVFGSLDEAMRLNPNDPEMIGFKARALRKFDAGNPDILPLARSWAEKKPKDGSARFFLSEELAKAGDVDSAIEETRAAIASSPEAGRYFHLADLLIRKERPGQALAAIDQAILLEPRRAAYHFLRGKILLKPKRYEESRTSLEKATSCDYTVPSHFHQLGHVCVLLGDHAGAARAFEEAAAREPANFRHHLRLAQQYRALRDRDRMLYAMEKAIRLKPEEKEVIEFKRLTETQFE